MPVLKIIFVWKVNKVTMDAQIYIDFDALLRRVRLHTGVIHITALESVYTRGCRRLLDLSRYISFDG